MFFNLMLKLYIFFLKRKLIIKTRLVKEKKKIYTYIYINVFLDFLTNHFTKINTLIKNT